MRQSITSDSTRLVHLQEALAEAGAEPARIVALPMGGTLVLELGNATLSALLPPAKGMGYIVREIAQAPVKVGRS